MSMMIRHSADAMSGTLKKSKEFFSVKALATLVFKKILHFRTDSSFCLRVILFDKTNKFTKQSKKFPTMGLSIFDNLCL